MTTKAKQAKKPSKVVYVATDAHVELAATAGLAAGNMVLSRIVFNDAAKSLFMAKVVIGDARTCPLAKAFLIARFTGKKIAASTKANALAGFRAAVASGKDYDENASQTAKRAEAKAKPAAATKPATPAAAAAAATPATPATPAAALATYSETNHVVAFPKKASAKKAAAELRKLVNKMKDNEEFSLLAACLIDALDEFDSEE